VNQTFVIASVSLRVTTTQTEATIRYTVGPTVSSAVAIIRPTSTYVLTPWSRVLLEKLTGFAASQEILCVLWNPKVHYCTHKCPPPTSTLVSNLIQLSTAIIFQSNV